MSTAEGSRPAGPSSPAGPQKGNRGGPGSAAGADSRRALVFGGGGVLGFAWTVGALRALETEWGIDANAVGLTVGTSAGSMLAALLGCGIPADVIRRHHQGVPAPADPGIKWDYASDSGGALPPWPGFVPGSPRLFLDAMLHPASFAPAVAFSGLLPRGRGSLDPIRAVIAAAVAASGGGAGDNDSGGRGGDGVSNNDGDGVSNNDGGRVSNNDGGGGGAPAWPTRPRTWIVATDYENGARVVFGRDRPGAQTGPVALGDAVAASCSIPGWYSPVQIGARHYIDGGTVSNASADLVLSAVADGTVDEVYVLAPMASVEPDRSRSPLVRLERAVRRAVTRGIQHDADRLRAAGARVVVLTPGPHDLDVMGANLMNPRRRTEVLQTSLLTSAAALRELRLNEDIAPRPSAAADTQASAGARGGEGARADVGVGKDNGTNGGAEIGVGGAVTAGGGARARQRHSPARIGARTAGTERSSR